MKRSRLIIMTIALAVVFAGCCSVPEIKDHNACFLGAGAGIRYMNIMSPFVSRDGFKDYISQQKDMGANFVYLYTINEHDGPWTPYSPYHGNQIGGELNQAVVDEYESRLEHVRDEGLGVILWLRADDSPNFNRASYVEDKYLVSSSMLSTLGVTRAVGNGGTNYNATASVRQIEYQKHMVELFDEYVSAYFVGLELDEYYNANQVEYYAAHLQGITDKLVISHQKPMKWDFGHLPSVDGVGVQTGFGKNEAYVQNAIANAKAQLGGKKVYGVEYHKSSETDAARNLGDAVMRGGGEGTGNNRNNPPKPEGWLDCILGWVGL